MKTIIKFLPIALLAMVITSCSSVRVAADYDRDVDFNQYKTFAFFKSGIDKAEISDLDKKRILRAIEAELLAKGYTKSENPDMLVSIFTKSNQRVDVYNNSWGFGAWGWGAPGWGWGWNIQPNVSTRTQGVLFVDLIDAKKKELVWQGQGTGYLSSNMEKKEQRIKEFVAKIMEKYPPGSMQ
ncbi:hypothetical protein FHS04_001346 [Mesoflavibacter sabulilitoris]|uniref:DUF4136 domain-containing protein n=1 Tax=Mesoflavibacter zeaxanthinifaciens subsp. sabulilitoris TaxID=1520893 RepID=A0A2T1N837_9FLAO|nr:DUF4136 domain-containing protein [Mesoflavibacter zeaxanthinifaciens]MBB3123837.1 hypothetical protein [Mesoflavibacter zeaxanthinifaciens subsp. sabulilitoris]PSG87983.1 DUF4136 domain-containing protein [Mesoflavibacter zeaxanthinifaciens subsp. sabulilitoris]